MSAVRQASKRATGDAGFAPFGCGSPALHQDPDARARRARDANRPSVAGRPCFSKTPSIVRKAGTTASRTRCTRHRITTEGAKSCRTSCMYQPTHDGQRGGGKHEKAIECCENAQVWSLQRQNDEAHSDLGDDPVFFNTKFTRRGTWCRWRWPRRRRHGQPCTGRWRA